MPRATPQVVGEAPASSRPSAQNCPQGTLPNSELWWQLWEGGPESPLNPGASWAPSTGLLALQPQRASRRQDDWTQVNPWVTSKSRGCWQPNQGMQKAGERAGRRGGPPPNLPHTGCACPPTPRGSAPPAHPPRIPPPSELLPHFPLCHALTVPGSTLWGGWLHPAPTGPHTRGPPVGPGVLTSFLFLTDFIYVLETESKAGGMA